MSTMLIPNPDLDFWNSDHKIWSWPNLVPKSQSCPFCLEIDELSISKMLIPNPGLGFEIAISKSIFGRI